MAADDVALGWCPWGVLRFDWKFHVIWEMCFETTQVIWRVSAALRHAMHVQRNERNSWSCWGRVFDPGQNSNQQFEMNMMEKKLKKNQTNLIFPAVWVWVMESTHRFLGQNTLSKWWNHRLWALPALESRQSKYYRRGVQGRRAGRLATPDMESFPIHWCH